MTAPEADPVFADPRLAELYDAFDGPRTDLVAYRALVEELGVRSVLDVGCGTGELACSLAARGLDVVGLDPARASLDVARRKPHADRVRWVHGGVAALPPLQVDLVTMTGNVAQVFLTDEEWAAALRAVRAALRPGGRFVFESRRPERRAWQEWTPERSAARVDVPGGAVRTEVAVTAVRGLLVSFRWTFRFEADGAVLTSDSTLRFRGRAELAASLTAAGLEVEDVRDAPDRPGAEGVFLARRPDRGEPEIRR
ncbi:class I SAM-dependent methyltransferase [Blastococcus sp. TML/M2B]|uniref:class I SAM-dependent methyltransferase n=1 Tax=unclassified Blastococcus TaxID=2619396 RepID=UPI00190BCAF7|nr:MULTISPECIES: class I SAM-dependent methyltransferase [unclassified Blastococcus]MBN1092658.1 class I SAM-dependent methyltransferase [Blastococcus sp. TML/M2B]MBN1097234.1 class I SAM-dependent methyltransferase [Blastococcus sp. TML/C7B]